MRGRVSMQKRCLMNTGLVEVVAGGRSGMMCHSIRQVTTPCNVTCCCEMT